jgi:hypothetical protein
MFGARVRKGKEGMSVCFIKRRNTQGESLFSDLEGRQPN